MTLDVVEVAQELIKIRSVNPMGHETAEGTPIEEGVTAYLKRFCESRNLPYEIQDVAPGRQNLLAMLPGEKAEPVLLLDAHQDTVPVENMVIDPFAGKVDQGRLWGRGACDVKGGMAAILVALDKLRHVEDRGTVLASFTCDEEHQQLGAQKLVAGWLHAESTLSGLAPASSFPRPDLAVITEPTQLDVVVAHRGVIRWTVSTEGQAAHSSQPELGTNAIYRMAQVVRVMEDIASTLGDRILPHPLCGGATLSVGTIHGGSSVNVVPDSCEIQIDRRLLPGEVAWVAHAEVSQRLADDLDFKVTASEPWCLSDPLVDQGNQVLAETLGAVAHRVAGAGRSIGVSYGTHAPRFAAAGIPTVVFGPGNIQQAHTKDEWIEIEALHQAVEILVQFCHGMR
jgi:succinyl-diaminopimelate desuccinylase